MSTRYQVNTNYTLTHGKPSLAHITINTTKSAVTSLPVHQVNVKSKLKTYRVFRNLKQAHSFIAHLKKVYCNIPQAVLDNGQQELFTGGTK